MRAHSEHGTAYLDAPAGGQQFGLGTDATAPGNLDRQVFLKPSRGARRQVSAAVRRTLLAPAVD